MQKGLLRQAKEPKILLIRGKQPQVDSISKIVPDNFSKTATIENLTP
jgi:hypothetical protein